MVMSENQKDLLHRQGRGEMKYDVFKEIDMLKKEINLNPSMDLIFKSQQLRLLKILENRMQKL